MNKIIDLTHPIEEGMTSFDAYWHPKVSIVQAGKIDSEGRETRKISFGSHTGTHMDAPLHFVKGGKSIDQIPLDKLIGKVTIVDLTNLKENQMVTRKMLENITITKRMLFKFGWGKQWGSKAFYQDYPFFSEEAVNYLIANNVELAAMDTPSPDDSRIKLSKEVLGSKGDSPMHKLFLKNGVILVEYIANLDQVEDYDGWNIIVMPLKIKGADGSPARVCIYKGV